MNYRYNIKSGVTRVKTNTKKYFVGAIASLVMVGGMAVPTLAASNSYCGSSANGCAAAYAAGAQCGTGASSGAFGYLGKDNNPGDPSWDGGNGTAPGTTAQTGLNNSGVCGNRQGNL